jgi:hypothetical protein
MKKRVRKIANFFAFNLLFFALYLNFIHKDQGTAVPPDNTVQERTAAFSGTVSVNNPEQYLEKKNVVSLTGPEAAPAPEQAGEPLRLSIN